MELDTTANSLRIKQTLFYKNTSKATLKNIVLIDQNNSYSSKTTPLAERFSEEYDSKFHFAKSEDRGYTSIQSIVDENNNKLEFKYDVKHPDNLNLFLNTAAALFLPANPDVFSIFFAVLLNKVGNPSLPAK